MDVLSGVRDNWFKLAASSLGLDFDQRVSASLPPE